MWAFVRLCDVVRMAEMDPQVCWLERSKSLGVKLKVFVLKHVIPSAVAALGRVKCPSNLCIFSNCRHLRLLKERALKKV